MGKTMTETIQLELGSDAAKQVASEYPEEAFAQESAHTDWEEIAKFYIGEIHGVLEHCIPEKYRVYVKGIDEHHSLAATLAISVAKVVKTLEEK